MGYANSGKLIRFFAAIENKRATKDVHELEFSLHYPVSLQVMLGLGAAMFLVLGILSAAVIDDDTGKFVCGGLFGLLFAVTLVTNSYFHRWRLKFDRYGMVYTTGFGRKTELRYPNIQNVRVRHGAIVLVTEDSTISIPDYVIGFQIFCAKLEEEHFEAVR